MDLEIGKATHSGQWALRISQALGAKEYINPSGGREIFDPREFSDAGIKLSFLEHQLPEYDQKNTQFQLALSIIDVMMFNSPEKIREMLDDYELE